MLIRQQYTVLFAHILLSWNSFTRKHFYTEALWHTVAGTFTCKYFYMAVFILRGFSLHTRTLCHRDAFDHTCFYTEIILHGDTFAQREMPLYTQILLQRGEFTLSNFTQKPKTNRGAFTKECMCTKVFSYGHIRTDILLNRFLWRTRVWRKEFSTHAKSKFHHSFWWSRRMSWERVGPGQTHIAILPQCMTIDISCERVAFRGHQSTLPCRSKRKS